MFEYHVSGTRRPLRRCEACAGPAPPDLPVLVERLPVSSAVWVPVRTIAKDFKQRQSGDREPGEEG